MAENEPMTPTTPTSLPSDESIRNTAPLCLRDSFTLRMPSGVEQKLHYDTVSSVGWVYSEIKKTQPHLQTKQIRLVHRDRVLKNLAVKLTDVFDGVDENEEKTLTQIILPLTP